MPETKPDYGKLALAANDALFVFIETMGTPYPRDGGDLIAMSHLFQGLFHRWPTLLTGHQDETIPPISVKVVEAIFDAAATQYLDNIKTIKPISKK